MSLNIHQLKLSLEKENRSRLLSKVHYPSDDLFGKLVSGTVIMEVTDGLSDEEIDEGYILCCQAQPTSGDIEIDIE